MKDTAVAMNSYGEEPQNPAANRPRLIRTGVHGEQLPDYMQQVYKKRYFGEVDPLQGNQTQMEDASDGVTAEDLLLVNLSVAQLLQQVVDELRNTHPTMPCTIQSRDARRLANGSLEIDANYSYEFYFEYDGAPVECSKLIVQNNLATEIYMDLIGGANAGSIVLGAGALFDSDITCDSVALRASAGTPRVNDKATPTKGIVINAWAIPNRAYRYSGTP